MLIYATHFKTDQKELDEHNHHNKAVIQQRRTIESYMLSRANSASSWPGSRWPNTANSPDAQNFTRLSVLVP